MPDIDDRKWFKVSLRFWGDHLPLDEMGTLLGLEPEIIGRIGEPVRRRLPAHVDPSRVRRFDTNYWSWPSPAADNVPFEEQIPLLLDLLESRRSALQQILATPGAYGELFLGFSSASGQGGTCFSPELLSRIGALGLGIGLDLHAPSESDPALDTVARAKKPGGRE